MHFEQAASEVEVNNFMDLDITWSWTLFNADSAWGSLNEQPSL